MLSTHAESLGTKSFSHVSYYIKQKMVLQSQPKQQEDPPGSTEGGIVRIGGCLPIGQLGPEVGAGERDDEGL